MEDLSRYLEDKEERSGQLRRVESWENVVAVKGYGRCEAFAGSVVWLRSGGSLELTEVKL